MPGYSNGYGIIQDIDSIYFSSAFRVPAPGPEARCRDLQSLEQIQSSPLQSARGLRWTISFITKVEVSRMTLGNVDRLSS